MRKTAWLASILLLATLPILGGKPPGPASVKIAEAAKKQPPVAFPHEKHQKSVKTCDVCHHTDKGLTLTSKTEVKKCAECHLDPKDNAPSIREMSLTKNPYHKVCVTCHKEQKKGPTACAGCHKK